MVKRIIPAVTSDGEPRSDSSPTATSLHIDPALLAERRTLGQEVAYELAAIAELLVHRSQAPDEAVHDGFVMRTIGARLDALALVVFTACGEYEHATAIQDARHTLFGTHDMRGQS